MHLRPFNTKRLEGHGYADVSHSGFHVPPVYRGGGGQIASPPHTLINFEQAHCIGRI